VLVGEGFRGPDGKVGYLLRQAQQALRHALDSAVTDLGISSPQYSVLSMIEIAPGSSGVEIADQMVLTPQTVNGILLALDPAGLVERGPDPDDKRVLRAYLTQAGRALTATARTRVSAVEERMTSRLTPAQRRQLNEALVSCALALSDDAREWRLEPEARGELKS
jgi:DNA-binding MarR family transcriptional regulator